MAAFNLVNVDMIALFEQLNNIEKLSAFIIGCIAAFALAMLICHKYTP